MPLSNEHDKPDRGPTLSIIIINYNGRRYLTTCLEAVLHQLEHDCEVLVVDNGSTDGSVEFVRTSFPQVRVLALERNLGFAGGNNEGARASRGRYLVFLNNDTRAEYGWLSALRRGLRSHAWATFATSRIVYMHDPGTIDSAGDGMTRWGGAFKHHHGHPKAIADQSREVFAACGAAFMIPRDVFEQLGGFDEDYFMVCEDVDLSYRAQLLGYRCVYVADAIVEHAGSGSLGRVNASGVYYGQRNLEWTYFKNTPAMLLIRSLPGHFIYLMTGCVYYAAVGLGQPYIRAKFHALLGLPSIWRKRRTIQAKRRAAASHLWGLMDRGWLPLKWREKTFDLRLAGKW